ncbi:16S rRNA (uracil(1498)-N(3))-methyltransferase [Haliangium ochraceum]|uniref:Ribosomal RNA small subunit methyltransferase E n=1 Tax=Haliangium ochraceum (strain DSM 14365 / JCM 11303 / SMP-2) TaxID=502025 RepID=D0LYS8_HALO1|nr:RsmE family RNA methyltransferase [Haliangium ochraceum]ACY14398.1 protein of unknown function DUF558 [Haliangium ochraceum DSM 14365]
MNLLLFEAHEFGEGDRLVLSDRRAQHVQQVLRASLGDRVRVGMVRGPTGVGEIVDIGDERVEMVVSFTEPAPERPRVDLILAVPRPKALSRVLQTASELGVGHIDLVNAWRVDKSYFDSHHLDLGSLAHHVHLGCEQSGNTWVPEISVHRLLMPFLDEVMPQRLAGAEATSTLIAHPRAAEPIENIVPPGPAQRVLLAIGPEGGWIERELSSFTGRGFVPVTCTPRVLRVETALAALLSQLALLSRLG